VTVVKQSYELLETNTVYSGRAFNVLDDRVRLPNGCETTRQTVTHPGAAVFLPQRDDGVLLLVEQYRHAIGKLLVEFPAGTLEYGEEPLACAKRELAEEVGCAAEEWTSLGTIYPAPGFCNELQHFFLARDLSPAIAETDEDEIIELREMSVAEVKAAIKDGSFCDGKSIAIFMRAWLGGFLSE